MFSFCCLTEKNQWKIGNNYFSETLELPNGTELKMFEKCAGDVVCNKFALSSALRFKKIIYNKK
ncbi:hypothetical protein BH23BAC3_BH23BAC3_35600 [soil metagenome]